MPSPSGRTPNNDPKELTLDISGSHDIIDGLAVSRSHLKIGGSWNLLRHGTEYGLRSEPNKPAFDLSGSNNCFSPEPVQNRRNSPTAPDGFPLPFSGVFDPDGNGNILEHFAPRSAQPWPRWPILSRARSISCAGFPFLMVLPPGAATAPGCVDGGMVRSVQGLELDRGLYYVTGGVILNASNLLAKVTIVSGGRFIESGSQQGIVTLFTPYVDDLLFATQFDLANNTANTVRRRTRLTSRAASPDSRARSWPSTAYLDPGVE